MAAVAAAAPLSPIIQANPGSHTSVLRLGVKNPGRPAGATSLAEPNIVVTGTKLRFFKAVNNGGQWSMGAAMTKTEVQQLATNVFLTADGKTVASGNTAFMATDGTVTLSSATNVPERTSPSAWLVIHRIWQDR